MNGFIDSLKVRQKQLILVLSDILFVSFVYIVAVVIFRLNSEVSLISLVAINVIYIAVFFLFKLYSSLWRFAGSYEFLNVIFANVISMSLFFLFSKFLLKSNISFEFAIILLIFSSLFTVSMRMLYRLLRRYLTAYRSNSEEICLNTKKTMVVGAGYTGSLIIKEMLSNPHLGYKPVVVIDDDKKKAKSYINRVKVIGGREDIKIAATEYGVKVILIAIARIDGVNKKEIINICKETGCEIKIIPSYDEILNEKVFLNKMRDVQVEELLGRDTVKLDMDNISEYLSNKTILITGGGGSIGSEICRQVSRFSPKQLVILDIYENNVYDLQIELKRKYPDLNMSVIIASVRDKNRLDSVFAKYRPDVVFHAAAHKHVPLMEDNPCEAIKNNVFGTLNTCECADKYGVKRFVMISTDKAVNPTNIMGATKRICEFIVQAIDKVSDTKFVGVRFGNVLGSNGSVIPLFKKQILEGGPVTVTDKNITRFFMTIPEASQLVLQAGAFAKGGEIFVLDMGESVKIYDLACDLIKLSGFEPNKDIEVKVTGLRPGEKLYEELLMKHEISANTEHKKIFVGKPDDYDFDKLKNKLNSVRLMLQNESEEMAYFIIKDLVPSYEAKNEKFEKMGKCEVEEIDGGEVAVEGE
ncbi:polysaccharide biosynthesis protein [Clostridium sp. DL1XJH146]